MSLTRATTLAVVALAAAVPSALALHDAAAPVTGMAAAKAASRRLAATGDGGAANPLPNVDHLKCYRAVEPPPTAPLPPPVLLADQFGAGQQKIGKVVMLCNPVV